MNKNIILTTTPSVEGKNIVSYVGVVHADVIIGVNIFSDIMAGIRDIVGGRSASYEEKLVEGKDLAMQEIVDEAIKLGADAVVGIDFDYETVGAKGSMLMINVSGTAVKLG